MLNYPQMFETLPPHKSNFGGAYLKKSHAKLKRPLNSKQALHLVLRSKLAKGERSFLRGARQLQIRKLVERQCDRFGVKMYRYANSGNHLHLLVRPSRRRAEFVAFLRAISGLIARLTMGVERGRAKGIKFWDARPFSRIVSWGKSFQICARYIEKNVIDALGFAALGAEELRNWRWTPG